MGWEVAVSGTVCLDDVTTPAGRRREQPGGSALYFAVAAGRFARVHLAAVVGEDGDEAVRAALAGVDVDLEGLCVDSRPTRRWRAIHDFERWVTASECSEEGAAARAPRLSEAAARAEVLFLGSMAPAQQLSILEASRARLVGIDSMVVHIRRDAATLWRALEGSDVLFLNRSELGALTGCPDDGWQEAAGALCRGSGRLRAVVVKGGPLGAACVTATGIEERSAPPVATVIDPTGAGDSLAGGFLGACAAAELDSAPFFGTALDAGLGCAADAIAGFGVTRLRAGGFSGR
ncbi:MAG TPA: PfkB family carbohydrate kinase [Candidatus Dormibacteraeota bacterium]